jgi:hypothetical protein
LQFVEQIKSKGIAEATKIQHSFTDVPLIDSSYVAVKPNLLQITLALDPDQLIKELAKQGYQFVAFEPNPLYNSTTYHKPGN